MFSESFWVCIPIIMVFIFHMLHPTKGKKENATREILVFFYSECHVDQDSLEFMLFLWNLSVTWHKIFRWLQTKTLYILRYDQYGDFDLFPHIAFSFCFLLQCNGSITLEKMKRIFLFSKSSFLFSICLQFCSFSTRLCLSSFNYFCSFLPSFLSLFLL